MFVLKNFRSYQMAIVYYKECRELKLPSHLKDQMLRAASSTVLNLAEGSAKPSLKDRMRYYSIAFGSLRETQSILQLVDGDQTKINALILKADHLGACIFKLIKAGQSPVGYG